MSAPPISLITAAHVDVRMPATATTKTARVPLLVADGGTKPLTVTIKGSEPITMLARSSPAGGWLEKIRPAKFTLQPGQSRTVVAVFRVPPHQTGRHGANLFFSASPVGAHGAMVQMGVRTGATIEFEQPGKTVSLAGVAPYGHHGVPTAPPPSSLPLDAGAAGGAVLALAAMLAVWGAWRRRRRTRQAQQPQQERVFDFFAAVPARDRTGGA